MQGLAASTEKFKVDMIYWWLLSNQNFCYGWRVKKILLIQRFCFNPLNMDFFVCVCSNWKLEYALTPYPVYFTLYNVSTHKVIFIILFLPSHHLN